MDGKSTNGHDQFSVTLEVDEYGFIGRECKREGCQPKYFHIKPQEETVEHLHCPYCDYVDHLNQFYTKDQMDYIRSMITRDAMRTIDNMFKRSFGGSRRPSRRGFISISLEYKSGTLPSVRHYSEKKLHRRVMCDQCGGEYAVYGLALFCPWCGQGNLNIHLSRSVDIIKSLLESRDEIIKKHGSETGHHLLGNCPEDCVSLFEGFMKTVYKTKLKEKISEADFKIKISSIGNSFQNVRKAQRLFDQDVGINIFDSLAAEDLQLLEEEFSKRHVITHNLGLVDAKFQKQVQTWQNLGQNIPLAVSDIENVLRIIQQIIHNLIIK